MKSANYTRKHHMYLMNHKNGDVIEVRMDKRNKTFKKIRLYRQDGLGNYYLDPHAEFKDQKSPATKENIVEAGKRSAIISLVLRTGTIKLDLFSTPNTKSLISNQDCIWNTTPRFKMLKDICVTWKDDTQTLFSVKTVKLLY